MIKRNSNSIDAFHALFVFICFLFFFIGLRLLMLKYSGQKRDCHSVYWETLYFTNTHNTELFFQITKVQRCILLSLGTFLIGKYSRNSDQALDWGRMCINATLHNFLLAGWLHASLSAWVPPKLHSIHCLILHVLVACIGSINDWDVEFLLKHLVESKLYRTTQDDGFSLVVHCLLNCLPNQCLCLLLVLLELVNMQADSGEGDQSVLVAILTNELPHLRLPFINTNHNRELPTKPTNNLKRGFTGGRNNSLSRDSTSLLKGSIIEAGDGHTMIPMLTSIMSNMGDRTPYGSFKSTGFKIGDGNARKVQRHYINLHKVINNYYINYYWIFFNTTCTLSRLTSLIMLAKISLYFEVVTGVSHSNLMGVLAGFSLLVMMVILEMNDEGS